MTRYSLVSALVIASIAAMFVLVGRRSGGRKISALDVIVAAGLLLVTALAQAILLPMLFGIDKFGVAHVIYLVITLSLPVLGAILIAVPMLPGQWKLLPNITVPGLMACTLLLIPGAIGWYASRIEPFSLGTERVAVGVAPQRSGDQSMRVGVISDIQNNRVGDHEWAAVRRLMQEKPDIILYAGDLFQGSDEQFRKELPEFRELMAQLSAPYGVYAVRGNTESREEMAALLADTGVNLLFNDVVQLEIADRTVTLGGTDYHLSYPQVQETIDSLEEPGSEDDIRILMSHTPDVVDYMTANTRIDLVVSGHTHGGQIALPQIGPLFDNVRVPRSVSGGGLSTIDGKRIYVTTGVGMERGQAPQVRFGVPPTIDILTIGTARVPRRPAG